MKRRLSREPEPRSVISQVSVPRPGSAPGSYAQPAGSKTLLASHTTWCIFPADSDYFGGTRGAPFMVNYRVADLDGLLALLKREGCAVDDKTEVSEYGRFGWVTDPEGNRVELWQPPK